MRAAAGDEILVKGRRAGDEGREGVPSGVQGADGMASSGASEELKPQSERRAA
jgi:hypothetical protein